MTLNVSSVASDMLGAAVGKAGKEWKKIKNVATVQIRNLAHNLVEIARNAGKGSLDAQTARQLTAMAKNNAIAMIAMMTQLVFAAIQKIIKAALDVVKLAINKFATVTLL